MSITNVSTNGQVTLPVRIRKALGLTSGDPVDIALDESGRIIVTPVTIRPKDLSDFDVAAQRSLVQYEETYQRLADS